MNADVRSMKTAAEQSLADGFATAKATLPGQGTVPALREAAFRRFDVQGLPHRRLETWRYTDLRAAMREARPMAGEPDAATQARAKTASPLPKSLGVRRIVFADGIMVPELSDLAALEPGLTIHPMAQALAAGDPLIAQHLGLRVFEDALGAGSAMMSADARRAFDSDPAVTLNTALMRDGVLIHVAEGALVSRPIQLVFATGERSVSVFCRSLLIADHGSRVTLIESHDDGHDCQINTATEVVVADAAQVDHVKITTGAAGLVHVGSMMATIGANARFNSFHFTTGGALVRNQLFMRFEGEGAMAGLGGATLLKGKEHVDNTLFADHQGRSCHSREVFKAVLDDESHSVFQGRIIVRQKAQKTDAKMMTQALLLSDEAEADHKPELEIFADDVQCGHGATSGALDDALKFYLMARGIPLAEAEALLVQAFVGEAVEQIENIELREVLMERVVTWLSDRGARR